MKARIWTLGVLAAALCALPILAQDIPAGDDVWDSLGGGATDTTLSSADWRALCGAIVPNTAVQLKGFNIPGQGTGDTVVSRLEDASFANGPTTTVKIQLKDLSMVNDGPHPCSPLSLRVSEADAQQIGTMTITRTSAAGGTFSAKVPVSAVFEALDGAGNVVGSTAVSGILADATASPWSYLGPSGLSADKASFWHPGVDPQTLRPVRVCRRGNKTLPARHCYWPPPKCPVIQPVPTDAVAQPAEPCSVETL